MPKSPKKTSTTTTSTTAKTSSNTSHKDDDEYYHSHWKQYVITSVPPISNNSIEALDKLNKRIAKSIKTFYKETNYLIRPDPDSLIEIAKLKIPNNTNLQNLFIFGDESANHSVVNIIRNTTKIIDGQSFDAFEHRYKDS